MNLYEVVRWGNASSDPLTGGPNGLDTCFLVRASSEEEAGALADAELERSKSLIVDHWAGAVYLLGVDGSVQTTARILRGPYVQHAYRHGWKAWYRQDRDGAWVVDQRSS